MRRHARANPFARRQINALLRELKASSADEWSMHLAIAHKILRGELTVSDEVAHSIIAESVSVAHSCAKAIGRRVGNIYEFQARKKLCKACTRIANCAKRAPAEIRTRLDSTFVPLIRQEHVDLEVIEAIFDAAVEVFSNYSHQEVAKTALAVLTYQPPGGERYITVKNDFSGLSAKDRIKSEKALAVLRKASKKRGTTASDIFAALAGVLRSTRSAKVNSQIHTLIVDYVAAVADIWRRAGLRPSRARHPADPTYKSKFHRFVDLILTEMVEPWARRHHGRPTLRRVDVEWLVSADHIAKALRRRFKKPTEILRKR